VREAVVRLFFQTPINVLRQQYAQFLRRWRNALVQNQPTCFAILGAVSAFSAPLRWRAFQNRLLSFALGSLKNNETGESSAPLGRESVILSVSGGFATG